MQTWHATSFAGGIGESYLLVLNLQPNDHATYSAGSVSESDSLVDESLNVQPSIYFQVNKRVTFTDTSSRRSSMEVC